jgi:hypothetical protein
MAGLAWKCLRRPKSNDENLRLRRLVPVTI